MGDLKAKLPFGKKPNSDGEESEESGDAESEASSDDKTDAADLSNIEASNEGPKSLVDKFKSLLNKKKDPSADDKPEAEGNSASTDAGEAAKKKKSRIIQIVIVAGLVLFVLSDYINPPEEPAEKPVVDSPAKRARKNPKNPPVDQKPVTDPTTTDPTTSPDPVTSGDPTTTPDPVTGGDPTTTPDPVTGGDPTTTLDPVTSGDPTPTPDTPNPPVDVKTDPVTDPGIEPQPDPGPNPDTPVVDTPPDVNHPPPVVSDPDTIDGKEPPPGDDSLTDQILSDLEKQAAVTKPVMEKKEYVGPPDYEYRGRGLVYNCKGKHWACVDGPSYKTCEDNASSVKYLKKKTECYPYNIYETNKGCESMQNRMVSTSSKTTFCNE